MKHKLLLALLIAAMLFSSCKDNTAQTLYTDDGATHVAETTAVPETTSAPQTTSVPETTAAPDVGGEQSVEDWMFKFETPGYDAWADIEGEYAIWEFTKNADGEFVLTYSEGDVLCIPYVKIGASEIVYATQQTIWAPALEIGTPHTLQAHEEIRALFQLDTKGGQFFGESYSDPYNADGIYADMFAKYCRSAPEAAELLRESAGQLRDILRVWYNGEAVDGIGITPPSYYFIREHAREWQFIFSKSYALADVNTVRIELRIPDTLSDAQ
ncbi:MAG: hypothetical protein IJX64_01780 [Clostridia bacterium]|nr:hypothetical protein [Clostridia bacterium]